VDGELAEQLADASTPLNDEPGDSPALAAALSALPEEQRAAIAFRYYREMPVRDIADVLGNSPKAVESLLGRARRRLRQLLGENND
jgi:RNA polymerase sigma-70 factor (ECF subfamily)